MKRIMCFTLVCLAATGLFAGVACATTQYSPEYSSMMGGASAGWVGTLTVPKFNPSLGTLMGVKFTLIGDVSGTARFENLANNSATVDMSLSAKINLKRPAPLSTVILVSLPLAPTSDTVAAYDGTTDYSGPSGRTHASLTATDTQVLTSTDAADLLLFKAAFLGENIMLPVTSSASSSGSSADTGDLAMLFNTNAQAEAKVQYIYDAVPEPSGILALLTGACSLIGVATRRRRA